MGFVTEAFEGMRQQEAERDALAPEYRRLLQSQYKTIGEGGRVNDDPLEDYVLADTGMRGNIALLEKLRGIQEKISGKKGELVLLEINYTRRRFRSHEFAVGFQWWTSERQKYIFGFLKDDQLHVNYSGDFSHGPGWLLEDNDAFTVNMTHSFQQTRPHTHLALPFGVYGPEEECSHEGACSTKKGLCYGDYDIGYTLRQNKLQRILVGEENVHEYFVNAEKEELFETMYALLFTPDAAI